MGKGRIHPHWYIIQTQTEALPFLFICRRFFLLLCTKRPYGRLLTCSSRPDQLSSHLKGKWKRNKAKVRIDRQKNGNQTGRQWKSSKKKKKIMTTTKRTSVASNSILLSFLWLFFYFLPLLFSLFSMSHLAQCWCTKRRVYFYVPT